MTPRGLDRVGALVVVALLTWPFVLLFAQYPAVVPYAIVGFAAGLVGMVVGHGIGRTSADHLWRRLFVELGVDHGHELQQRDDQLAKADQTIDMLRRNDGVAFMAGQMLRADLEEHDL